MTTSQVTGSHEAVLAANVELSARAASNYNETEPHYLPENVERVSRKLDHVIESCRGTSLLDLGCGTGFIIDIARSRVKRIHGVDASLEMLDRVDLTGPAHVTVEAGDTASIWVDPGSYDIVTAYSVLHHLFEPEATLTTAARALRPGGILYVDLEPNRHFWSAISALDSSREFDPIVTREIQMVIRHDGVVLESGVDTKVFDLAEWGKTRLGGIDEAEMQVLLERLGFEEAVFSYSWFVGQGMLINDPDRRRSEALGEADVIASWLLKALPMSRSLFKYVGFTARKSGGEGS